MPINSQINHLTPHRVAAFAIIISIIIIIHHIYIHPEYDFPDRAFQISDVADHETWVIASLAFAAGLYVSQFEYFKSKPHR